MKKSTFLTILLWGLIALPGALAAQGVLDVTLTNPGELKQQLQANPNIEELNVSGQLNGDDFGAIRALTALKVLNLAEAQIVAGGGYTYNSENVSVQDNRFPAYFCADAPIAATLESVTLPAQATHIETQAFKDAVALSAITLPETLQELGNACFMGCSTIEEITLPDELTQIGESAFEGCASMAEVVLPETVLTLQKAAFRNCTGLEFITLSPLLKEIPEAAFMNCGQLEEIELPLEVNRIGDNAFNSCSTLLEVELPALLRTMGQGAFHGCVSLETVSFLGDGLRILPAEAFTGCYSLEAINLPNAIQTIEAGAFAGCTALYQLTFPAHLQVIEQEAFMDTRIGDVVLPRGVQSIGVNAFANNPDLRSVLLGDAVAQVGKMAFIDCEDLTALTLTAATPPAEQTDGALAGVKELATAYPELTVYVPKGAKQAYQEAPVWKDFTNIKDLISFTGDWAALAEEITDPRVLGYLTLTGEVESELTYALQDFPNLLEVDLSQAKPVDDILLLAQNPTLQKIVLPAGLKEISEEAFAYNQALQSITLPQALELIGESAFTGCGALQEINLPQTVTEMGEYAFQDCASLEKITMPSEAIAVPAFTFYNCIALKEVNINKGLTDIDDYAFGNCIALPRISLPETMAEIREGAFIGTDALDTIVCAAPTPAVLDESAFTQEQYQNIVIVVPTKEALQSYQEDDAWKLFKNYYVADRTSAQKPTAPASEEDLYAIGTHEALVLVNATPTKQPVEIYNLQGQRIYTAAIGAGAVVVPLQAGLYVVRFTQQTTHKVVVR